MINLKASVSKLAGVGPKYLKLLEKLYIYTTEDFLYYFPFRYDDFTNISTIDNWQNGQTLTTSAQITSITNVISKNGKRLTIAQIQDNTAKGRVVWFNQHFLIKVLKKNITYNFSGKVAEFNEKNTLVNPIFESVDNQSIHTQGLVPIYPETEGVSSKWLRTKIKDLVTKIDTDSLDEYLPEHLLNEYDLLDINTAIKDIHFPQSHIHAQKAKDRLAFEEIFFELLNVEYRKYELENKHKGIKLNINQTYINEFIATLPFELTSSQNDACDHLLRLMQINKPMNSLLAGDVGSGKTIVAAICAYAAYTSGYRTVYLAPTEILANQHFQTFSNLFTKLGIKLQLVTSNTKEKTFDADMLIGTHALLYKEDIYKKIGFVVIDEQHRFGVEQRHKISKVLTANETIPHVLSMTATPIPRTLALTLFGDLDICTLDVLPNKDKKIITKAATHTQRTTIYTWIKNSNKRAFIVCPFIEVSDQPNLENVKAAQVEYETLKKTFFKNHNVGLLHGKLKPEEKTKIIEDFTQGNIQILVSTPVIEVGIDIPDAEIIVIESAERYGLASLHQLRGRVGRGAKTGYCFAIMSDNSTTGYSRLKHLETIDKGIELAEIDMQTRGRGDIFGTIQHGFKSFKLADLSDINLLEKAKKAAIATFEQIDTLPKLKAKLENKYSKFISSN